MIIMTYRLIPIKVVLSPHSRELDHRLWPGRKVSSRVGGTASRGSCQHRAQGSGQVIFRGEGFEEAGEGAPERFRAKEGFDY